MQGITEVYRNYGTPKQELIASSCNMLVDGAGETIADFMVLPPGIQDVTTSSILDTSNFTVQAISFGKNPGAFIRNAHLGSIYHFVYSPFKDAAFITFDPSISSVVPKGNLATYPDPRDNRLERSVASASDFFGLSPIPEQAEFNQLLNALASGVSNSLLPQWLQMKTGCFPEPSGTTGAYIYPTSPVTHDLITTQLYAAQFNVVSSMDEHGFVTVTDTTTTTSGLVTDFTANIEDTGEVIYSVNIGSGDVGLANMYGGIEHLGLWTINTKETTSGGVSPPFEFSVTDNPIKYRLFAKKTFAKNITLNEDNGASPGFNNYADLEIVWRIKFL